MPAVEAPFGGGLIANTTGMKLVFQRIYTQFGNMYERKKYLHLYIDHGMEDEDFDVANNNLRNLLEQYQNAEDVVPNIDTDYDESDESDQSEDESGTEDEDSATDSNEDF